MRITTRLSALAAALLLGTAAPAGAQQLQDHQAHHPPGTQAQAEPAQPQAPSQAMPRQPGGPGAGMGMGGMGMMGPGGMGMGMMGQGGMGMGGPMMGPGMMGMMGGGMMGGPERIEGRLAFLRTELKITEAQQKAWDDFAQAMRSAAKQLQAAQAPMPGAAAGAAGPSGQMGPRGMMGMMGDDPVAHLEHHEQVYTARLEALRVVKEPTKALYNALDEAQKRTFAQLRPLYMAMM
jgi:hypothetical protein